MPYHKISTCGLIQTALCATAGIALFVSAAQLPAQQMAAESTTEAKAAANAPTAKEFAERKEKLMIEKKVATWPLHGTLGAGGRPVSVDLSVTECTWLGGSVVYHSSCSTGMKCVAKREMCITEIK